MAGRIMVTGGAGFIGSELVRQLADLDHDVVVLDNFASGKPENLSAVKQRITVVEGDIRDAELVKRTVAGCDRIFHLACLGVRHSIHDPIENHSVNADGTLVLLVAAREAQVRRFVNVSTSEVYGTAKWVPMTTDHPTMPMTVYGASKLAGECYARAFHRTYAVPTVVVRPFNAFGPRSHHEGDQGEVIPKFVLRALAGEPLIVFGDGEQTRDFTYVADSARGIMLAGFSDAAVGETINIGHGSEVTINRLAQIVGEALSVDVDVRHEDPRPGDVLRLFCDPAPAKSLLGYEPTTSLVDGLGQLTSWYRSLDATVEDLLRQELVHNWRVEQTPEKAQ